MGVGSWTNHEQITDKLKLLLWVGVGRVDSSALIIRLSQPSLAWDWAWAELGKNIDLITGTKFGGGGVGVVRRGSVKIPILTFFFKPSLTVYIRHF